MIARTFDLMSATFCSLSLMEKHTHTQTRQPLYITTAYLKSKRTASKFKGKTSTTQIILTQAAFTHSLEKPSLCRIFICFTTVDFPDSPAPKINGERSDLKHILSCYKQQQRH